MAPRCLSPSTHDHAGCSFGRTRFTSRDDAPSGDFGGCGEPTSLQGRISACSQYESLIGYMLETGDGVAPAPNQAVRQAAI